MSTMLSSAPGPRLSAIPLHTLYTLLEPVTVPAHHPRSTFINWGLTYICRPLAVFEPETEYQCELIFELARREGKTVRATGVGHSPSDLACTSGYMLRTEKLNKIIEVGSFLLIWPFAPFRGHRHPFVIAGRSPYCDPSPLASISPSVRHHSSVHVTPAVRPCSPLLSSYPQVNAEKLYIVAQGGVTLNAVHAALDAHGLAMTNLGSISDQTLAGMVTTSTHGSGIHYKVLSTHVLSLLLLLPDGSRVHCSREKNPELFMASLCGLGSTGLILEVTLEVEPAFLLKETQESLPFDEVLDKFDDLVHSAEHVRFWWFPAAGTVRVSAANRTDEVRLFLAELHAPWLTYTPTAQEAYQHLVVALPDRLPPPPIPLLPWTVFHVPRPPDRAFRRVAGVKHDGGCG